MILYYSYRRCYHWKGTLMHYWWKCKLVQPLWKTVQRFLKKIKNKTTIQSSNFTSEYLSLKKLQKTQTQKICVPLHILQHYCFSNWGIVDVQHSNSDIYILLKMFPKWMHYITWGFWWLYILTDLLLTFMSILQLEYPPSCRVS